MNDALDSTISMGQKMDLTNEGMAITNAGMSKTNASIHKQTLLVALDEILKFDNATYLLPPIGMMPPGDTFGGEATPLEMIKIAYLWIMDISTSQSDGTAAQETELQHKKNAKFNALQVIAGLAPQEKIEQLISLQVNQGGRYESTVYSFLMLRAAFIDGILIQESLLSKSLTNPGMFEEALKYVQQVEFISKLPFKGKIAFQLPQKVIFDDEVNIDLQKDIQVKARYEELKTKLSQLDQIYSSSTDNSMKARIEAIKAQIDQGISRN
jgi:hypothetical protein